MGFPNFSLANALLSNKKDVDVNSLAIYPNPALSETTISVYTGMEANIEYVILIPRESCYSLTNWNGPIQHLK